MAATPASLAKKSSGLSENVFRVSGPPTTPSTISDGVLEDPKFKVGLAV